MKNNEEAWSDDRPYYMLYQDKAFLKNIYSQIFSDFPDIGVVAYIGANTHRKTQDYSLNGEQGECNDKKKSCNDINIEKNRRNDCRQKAGLNFVNSEEYSEIREYANIQEIKEMNNMLFYKKALKDLVNVCLNNKCTALCFLHDYVELYDSYKEGEDVFVKIGKCCVWLKQSNMDTNVVNLANIMGKVHMVGYILDEESEKRPRIIKAIAIYT